MFKVPLWLVNNWKWMGSALLTLIVCAVVGYFVNDWHTMRLEKAHTKEMEALTLSLTNQCQKDKALTSEVSNAFQDRIDALNSRVAGYKRLLDSRPSTCVPVTEPSSERDASGQPGQPSRPRGIMAGALLDLGAEGDQYREQLSACQDFIRKTWASKGN